MYLVDVNLTFFLHTKQRYIRVQIQKEKEKRHLEAMAKKRSIVCLIASKKLIKIESCKLEH